MHVQTMSMDPRIARVHYSDFMKRCKAHREERRAKRKARAKELGKEMRYIQIEMTNMEKEDIKLLQAYKAIAKGQRILHLPTVIRDGGFDKNNHWLPRLAVAPADAKKVVFDCNTCSFDSRERDWKHNNRVSDAKIPRSMFIAEVTDTTWRKNNNHPNYATALVPTIPPMLRPDEPQRYYILWEAEWRPHRAPEDPILLSRINDDFYVILAQWDLTPLEQKIMEGRA